MKLHTEFQQGSYEWHMAHVGIPTAGSFDQLVTPGFEIRKGEMPKTYLAKKLAEAWQNGPLPGFGSFFTEQGQLLEQEAIPFFEFQYGQKIDRVGFCTTDDGRIGCSPDGLIGDDSGIEIKCPAAETQVRYLLAGKLPDIYGPQVHGAMFVTGKPSWKFLSYRRNFPTLLLEIERDQEKIEIIEEALRRFLFQFDLAMMRLQEINGGPPPKVEQTKPRGYGAVHVESDEFHAQHVFEDVTP